MMPRVTEEHLERRREQILQSARTLLLERGLSHVSMADLVGASGLSTGAVYRYFDSKEALIVAVCVDLVQGYSDTLSRCLNARAGLSWLLDVAEDVSQATFVTQIWGEAPMNHELKAAVARSHDALAGQLAQLIETDRGDRDAGDRRDARETADVVIAAVDGYRERLSVGAPVSRSAFERTLRALLGAVGA